MTAELLQDSLILYTCINLLLQIIYKTLFPQRTPTVALHVGTTMAIIGSACIISLFVDCISLTVEISVCDSRR